MPIEVKIEFESDDLEFFNELSSIDEINENISASSTKAYVQETISPWHSIEYIIELARNFEHWDIAKTVVINLLSNFLYDKIRNRKTTRMKIGENVVSKDKDSITKSLMENIIYAEHYTLNFSYPYSTEEEIMRGARTLVDGKLTFNERELTSPDNEILSSDYINGSVEVKLRITDQEVIKTFSEKREIYAKAEVEDRQGRLFFGNLILNSNITSPIEEWVLLKKSS